LPRKAYISQTTHSILKNNNKIKLIAVHGESVGESSRYQIDKPVIIFTAFTKCHWFIAFTRVYQDKIMNPIKQNILRIRLLNPTRERN